MYIIIAGGGIVGRKITEFLSKSHDVVVIEKDKQLCEKIYSKYGAIAINGDATNINTLKEAGIEKCDYALGVMSYDAQNLLFSLLSKNFGIKNIFVRMRDPDYKTAYELAGATNIAASVEMMVRKFILDIENPETRTVASLGNGKAVVSIITIPENSLINEKTISEIASIDKFPQDCIIAGIFDQAEDKLIVPRGNQKVFSGNQIFIVAPSHSIQEAVSVLLDKHEGIIDKLFHRH